MNDSPSGSAELTPAPPRLTVPFAPPCLSEEEVEAVVSTLRSGWLTTGPQVQRFESEFASYVGAQSALALSSGTAALHLALELSEVKPGDGVILSPLTFCSCAHVIEQVGSQPILVDIDSNTGNICPKGVEKALSRAANVRAMMLVHYGGLPCDMEPLVALARRHDLALIEDAAHAFPARYRGHFVGSPWEGLSHSYVAFSFYATKNLTTGEGGMLTGSSISLEKARALSRHGMERDAWGRDQGERPWHYDVRDCGYKYNMTDLQASIGRVQLQKVEDFHLRRCSIAQRYTRAFSTLDLQLPREGTGGSSWHLYPIRWTGTTEGATRDTFMDGLREAGIGVSVHFRPIHQLSYYREKYGFESGSFPEAERFFERAISLPIHPGLSDQDVDAVIDAVVKVATELRG